MSCSFLTTLFWWSISSSNFLKSDTWKTHFEILSFLACLIESLAGYEIIAWKLFSLQTSDIIPLSSYFWYCYWEVWYHSDFVCDLFPLRAFFFIPRTLQYHDDMLCCGSFLFIVLTLCCTHSIWKLTSLRNVFLYKFLDNFLDYFIYPIS